MLVVHGANVNLLISNIGRTKNKSLKINSVTELLCITLLKTEHFLLLVAINGLETVKSKIQQVYNQQ